MSSSRNRLGPPLLFWFLTTTVQKDIYIRIDLSRIMAGKKKDDGKHKNLDDVLNSLAKEHSKDLDGAFKAFDGFRKEEYQNHLYNNVFSVAHQDLYNAIESELQKSVGDDETKLKGKKKEVEKAIAAGLKKYFEKAQPSVVKKKMAELGISEDEEYDFLTTLYDDHVGVGKIKGVNSIKGLAGLVKDKNATAGHVKAILGKSREKYIQGALDILGSKNFAHHFTKFNNTDVAAYLKPKFEKAGYAIEDNLAYAQQEMQDLIQLRGEHIEKKGIPYMKKKPEEEKKKK